MRFSNNVNQNTLSRLGEIFLSGLLVAYEIRLVQDDRVGSEVEYTSWGSNRKSNSQESKNHDKYHAY